MVPCLFFLSETGLWTFQKGFFFRQPAPRCHPLNFSNPFEIPPPSEAVYSVMGSPRADQPVYGYVKEIREEREDEDEEGAEQGRRSWGVSNELQAAGGEWICGHGHFWVSS